MGTNRKITRNYIYGQSANMFSGYFGDSGFKFQILENVFVCRNQHFGDALPRRNRVDRSLVFRKML
jgi:hypothetical protein